MVPRATPNCAESVRAEGSRAPAPIAPVAMAARSRVAICKNNGPGSPGSNVIMDQSTNQFVALADRPFVG